MLPRMLQPKEYSAASTISIAEAFARQLVCGNSVIPAAVVAAWNFLTSSGPIKISKKQKILTG